MVGDKPARVHCNTCKAQHSYKANKPGTAAGTRKGTGKPRVSKYEALLNGKDMALAKKYSPKENYSPGDVVDHPSFGVGVTTAIKDGTKIEVVFEAGMKLLIHGR